MKRLFAAIASAFRAMRTTLTTAWTYCRDTGQWIATTVATTVGSIGGGGDVGGYDVPDAIAPVVDEQADALKNVRDLAAAISSGSATEEMCAKVDERTFNWLSQLDRPMIAKVLLATDDALRGHMRGKSTIRGVLQADEASVTAYKEAWMRKVEHDISYDNSAQMSLA